MNKLYGHFSDVNTDDWRWASFDPQEIASKGEGELLVNKAALDKLQELRDLVGKPIYLTSAYRSAAHNKRVGGAKSSKHMLAEAFDIQTKNHDPHELEEAARKVGFLGFGYYVDQGFLHVDMGPARSWGKPWPKKRDKITKSKTVRASAVAVASGTGSAVTAVSSLDNNAQYIVLVFAGIVVLAGLWIMKERIKKWAEGDR